MLKKVLDARCVPTQLKKVILKLVPRPLIPLLYCSNHNLLKIIYVAINIMKKEKEIFIVINYYIMHYYKCKMNDYLC